MSTLVVLWEIIKERNDQTFKQKVNAKEDIVQMSISFLNIEKGRVLGVKPSNISKNTKEITWTTVLQSMVLKMENRLRYPHVPYQSVVLMILDLIIRDCSISQLPGECNAH